MGGRRWFGGLLPLLAGCNLLLPLDPTPRDAAVAPPDAVPTDAPRPADAPRLTDARADLPLADTQQPDAQHADLLTPDTAPGPLFSDDFTGSHVYVGDGTGAWSMEGAVFKQTKCTTDVTKVKVPGQSWGDVRARVKVRADTVCSGTASAVAAVLLRVNGITNCAGNEYYWCNLDWRFPALRVGAHKGVCMTSSWGETPISTLQTGAWYWLELTAMGGQLTCKAWGGNLAAPVTATWTDPSPIPTGSVGLYTGQLTASFDDLLVELP